MKYVQLDPNWKVFSYPADADKMGSYYRLIKEDNDEYDLETETASLPFPALDVPVQRGIYAKSPDGKFLIRVWLSGVKTLDTNVRNEEGVYLVKAQSRTFNIIVDDSRDQIRTEGDFSELYELAKKTLQLMIEDDNQPKEGE